MWATITTHSFDVVIGMSVVHDVIVTHMLSNTPRNIYLTLRQNPLAVCIMADGNSLHLTLLLAAACTQWNGYSNVCKAYCGFHWPHRPMMIQWFGCCLLLPEWAVLQLLLCLSWCHDVWACEWSELCNQSEWTGYRIVDPNTHPFLESPAWVYIYNAYKQHWAAQRLQWLTATAAQSCYLAQIWPFPSDPFFFLQTFQFLTSSSFGPLIISISFYFGAIFLDIKDRLMFRYCIVENRQCWKMRLLALNCVACIANT